MIATPVYTDSVCTSFPNGHRFRFAGRSEPVEGVECDWPKLLVCVCGQGFKARCSTTSRSQCGPCSETYRRRVSRVARSGMVTALPGRVYILTLTAPGSHRHKYRGGYCPCTPEGGVDLAKWNGEAANSWNKFITDVRRTFGGCEYFAAKEVQKRGALHFHVPIRFDQPTKVRISKLRALAIRHGFGHELVLDELTTDLEHGKGSVDGSAWYVAKYVTKAADERQEVPYISRVTGEIGPGRWRLWTASRGWGLTMKRLRAIQAEWARNAVHVQGRGPDAEARCNGSGGAVGTALDLNTPCYALARLLGFPIAPPMAIR